MDRLIFLLTLLGADLLSPVGTLAPRLNLLSAGAEYRG